MKTDHCEALIYVEDSEARHEEIKEVACAEHPKSVVIVPCEEDGFLNCPFCDAVIEIVEDEDKVVHQRKQLRTFLCHASEDKVHVRKLFRRLWTWDHDSLAGRRSDCTGQKMGYRDTESHARGSHRSCLPVYSVGKARIPPKRIETSARHRE
jgi:uncharacterized protein YlaI